MKVLSILVLCCVVLFSCNKKEMKKEIQKFEEPEIEQPKPKVDEVKETKVEEIASELVFTVQIAALKKPNEDLLSIDGVKTYQENALTKFRLGNFETYKEARTFRSEILNEYKGAFVQALKNDKPISITAALQ